MILVYWIFLLSLAITGSAKCPSGCDCLPDPLSPNQQFVACRLQSDYSKFSLQGVSSIRSLQITCADSSSSIKEGLLDSCASTLQILKIEGCRLPDPAEYFSKLIHLKQLELDTVSHQGPSLTLKEDSLKALTKLDSLKITRSGLQRLPLDTFCVLKNLLVLNVSHNAINTVKTEPSCKASQLIIADFSHNDLDKIGDHFQVFPAVRQMSLARNRLSSLPSSTLEPMVHLQQLDIESNQLETIEKLPAELIHINLAYNRLSVVPPAVAQLKSLVSLNMSHNSIDESSPSVLASNSLESLDLSFNRIKILPIRLIPHSLGQLVHLNLEANLIENIKPSDLQNCSKLSTLNLVSNQLKILRDDVFSGIQHLSSLKLNNNSLDTIEQSVFADLTIDELNLSGNQFTEAPVAISRLYKLKKLDLSKNRISKLYQFIFNKIPHLHFIDLSHNELPMVLPYIFSDCGHLANLNLSNNHISSINRDAFSKCPLLKKLDVSRNRLESIGDSLALASSVHKLDLSHNRISILPWDSLPAKLEILYADNNAIVKLGTGYDTRVKTAHLHHNLLDNLTSEEVPKSIEYLDLSNNRIAYIAPGTFGEKSGLRRLNLAKNALTVVPRDIVDVTHAIHSVELLLEGNPLICSCSMDWIKMDLIKRRLQVIDQDSTYCTHVIDKRRVKLSDVNPEDLLCAYSSQCEPECICCQYGSCDCKAVCPTGCSCFHDANFERNIVKCSNLNSTDMKQFTPSEVPMSATHVYLSGLSLPILRSHSFMGRPRLQHLHINASRIQTIHPKAFNTLPKLKLLDLSGNDIVQLTGEEFHKTSSVSHLFLNGNGLTDVDAGLMNKLPALQLVTLHNNHLSNITEPLASSQILSVSLAGNPFRCDCNDRHTAPVWIAANRDRVVDIDRVRCVENVTKAFRENDTTILSAYPPNQGHDIFIMSMNEFLRDYNRTICVPITHGFFGQEPQNSILIFVFAAACLLLVFIVVMLLVSMARRTHSALQQKRYKASSLNSSTAGSSPLPQPLINYDVFISYSEYDRDLVDMLRRNLETDYTLCLLQQDCPRYSPSVYNISDELNAKVLASRSLIIILTRSFLQNEWSTLAIKAAHQMFAKDRTKRLIAITDDGVDHNLLDNELGQILRKNTCLRRSDPLFWQLLQSALPNRAPSETSQIYSDLNYGGIVPSAIV